MHGRPGDGRCAAAKLLAPARPASKRCRRPDSQGWPASCGARQRSPAVRSRPPALASTVPPPRRRRRRQRRPGWAWSSDRAAVERVPARAPEHAGARRADRRQRPAPRRLRPVAARPATRCSTSSTAPPGSSTRWLEPGEVEASTAGLPLIVVMPAGGLCRLLHRLVEPRRRRPPAVGDLPPRPARPWIDATYPTVGTRDGRAVAGESMGGLGTMHYAATRPDLFTAAAAVLRGHRHQLAGRPGRSSRRWSRPRAHHVRRPPSGSGSPTRSATGATTRSTWPRTWRGLLLQFYVGDGLVERAARRRRHRRRPGRGGDADHERRHGRAARLARDRRTGGDAFPGCHCWPQWADDLRELLPALMDRFAHPVRAAVAVHLHVDRPAATASGGGTSASTGPALGVQPAVRRRAVGLRPDRQRVGGGDDGADVRARVRTVAVTRRRRRRRPSTADDAGRLTVPVVARRRQRRPAVLPGRQPCWPWPPAERGRRSPRR